MAFEEEIEGGRERRGLEEIGREEKRKEISPINSVHRPCEVNWNFVSNSTHSQHSSLTNNVDVADVPIRPPLLG
eukprot:760415-Hanusia_phi.AAC.1